MKTRPMDALGEVEVDVVIVGGGPAGSSAALVLGRACKRVWLCDAGERRNEAAEHLHGFVTRDGIAPQAFRQVAREQLAPYDITFRAEQVRAIAPSGDGFLVTLETGTALRAARVLLATGVLDEPPAMPGMREAWGRSAFQCPHCHGWERRGRAWGVLLPSAAMADFALMLSGWTRDLTAFTQGAFEVPNEAQVRLARAGVRLETRPVARLRVEPDGRLQGIELTDGSVVPREVLFLKPAQTLPPLVRGLGLALDDAGYVRTSPQGETSIAGLFAAGDLTTPGQAAMVAAYQGTVAGWMMVHGLNLAAGDANR